MAISVSNIPNLQEWDAVVTIDHSAAISNSAYGNHLSVGVNNDPYYLWEGTVYTYNGDFDSGTGVIYKDEYGSPLTRCNVDCFSLCNQYSMTLASKNPLHSYHMEIPPYATHFNTIPTANSIYKLQYSTPCWLSRGDTVGPFEVPSPGYGVWYCTYITAYHDGPSILNSTSISINPFGGLTARMNHSQLYEGTGKQWWLTEVAETGGTHHVGHAVMLDSPSYSTFLQCNPWASPVPYQATSRGYSMPQYTYTSTFIRPKLEISCNYGGTGNSPSYIVGTPVVTYHYQDAFRTLGHHAFTGSPTGHLHESGLNPWQYYVPDTSRLTTCCPLYASSTPNATGGQSDRTMEASGWYQHSSKIQNVDPWFWWDQSTYTWTKTI